MVICLTGLIVIVNDLGKVAARRWGDVEQQACAGIKKKVFSDCAVAEIVTGGLSENNFLITGEIC